MALILRRYFFVLKIICIVIVSYFLAKGTAELLALELRRHLPEPEVAAPSPPKTPRRPAYRYEVLGDAILSRNIFDPTQGPLSRHPKPPPPSPQDEPPPEEAPLEPCTENGLVLEATVAVPNEPGASFASVSYQSDSSLYHVGDALAEGEIAWISWQYLILEKEESYCYLDLFEKRVKPPGRKQIRKGIKSRGRGKRFVDKRLLEDVLGNPGVLNKGITASRHKRGRANGYRIKRLSSSHPFKILGLKRNDVLTSIDGKPLESPQVSVTILDELHKRGKIDIGYVRRGKARNLNLRVR